MIGRKSFDELQKFYLILLKLKLENLTVLNSLLTNSVKCSYTRLSAVVYFHQLQHIYLQDARGNEMNFIRKHI